MLPPPPLYEKIPTGDSEEPVGTISQELSSRRCSFLLIGEGVGEVLKAKETMEFVPSRERRVPRPTGSSTS